MIEFAGFLSSFFVFFSLLRPGFPSVNLTGSFISGTIRGRNLILNLGETTIKNSSFSYLSIALHLEERVRLHQKNSLVPSAGLDSILVEAGILEFGEDDHGLK